MGPGTAMATTVMIPARATMPDPVMRRAAYWRRVTPGGALTALAAILLAGLAARDSAVFATANRYPQFAVKLAPANATAIVHVFDNTVLSSGDLQRDFEGWIAASRQALRADPLNASAIRLLAYVTELLPNGQPRARRLMALSEQASRRDVLAQVWLIEDAVNRGDVGGALVHYDHALLVKPGMAGMLIPVLVNAISEPAVRAALVPYLRADRAWTRPLLSVAVSKSEDPAAVADLFRRYGGSKRVPAHAEFETRLLARFIDSGNVVAARSFAAATGMAASANELRFTTASIAPRYRPLTWTLYDGPDGSASLSGDDTLEVSVSPEKRIVAASRTITAPARQLFLRQRVSFPNAAALPLVTWQAYCRRAAGPERFWTRDVPPPAGGETIQMPLDLPDGCQAVQLDLVVIGGVAASDAKAVFSRVELIAR